MKRGDLIEVFDNLGHKVDAIFREKYMVGKLEAFHVKVKGNSQRGERMKTDWYLSASRVCMDSKP